eukprot:TRINITY_DN829_c1_g1_i2.p1 TRINITY_DN829_c1_g1~~TRINITY_DN829_c1_g1_i2.p1  ORF type:complete len:605 (-),score=101.01 TRINITY_DN829_c1_g1_i2:51-1865(-)
MSRRGRIWNTLNDVDSGGAHLRFDPELDSASILSSSPSSSPEIGHHSTAHRSRRQRSISGSSALASPNVDGVMNDTDVAGNGSIDDGAGLEMVNLGGSDIHMAEVTSSGDNSDVVGRREENVMFSRPRVHTAEEEDYDDVDLDDDATGSDNALHPVDDDDSYEALADWQVTSVKYDAVLRRRNVLLLLNATLGVILMVLNLQQAWDHKYLHATTNRTLFIEVLITFSTAVLLYQLAEYYTAKCRIRQRQWGTMYLQEEAQGVALLTILGDKSGTIGWQFIFEAFICFVHPFPGLDPKFGLFMFLRVYLVCRVLRDYSAVYVRRDIFVLYYRGAKQYIPSFDWLLAIRDLFHRRPLLCSSLSIIYVVMTFGYCTYVFEREVTGEDSSTGLDRSNMDSYLVGIYLSLISMITGWPTDTYYEHNAATFGGRFFMVSSSAMGLLLLAEFIDVISRLYRCRPHQEYTVLWTQFHEIQLKESRLAAEIIQLAFRRHRAGAQGLDEKTYFQRKALLRKQFRETKRKKQMLEQSLDTQTDQAHARRLDDLRSTIDELFSERNALRQEVKLVRQNQDILVGRMDELLEEMRHSRHASVGGGGSGGSGGGGNER